MKSNNGIIYFTRKKQSTMKRAIGRNIFSLVSMLMLGSVLFQAGCQSTGGDDWLEVPIKACVVSNERTVEKSQGVVDYCRCMIPQAYEYVKNDKEKVALMKEGKLDFLITTNDPALFDISKKCLPAKRPLTKGKKLSEVFDDRMEKGIRLSLLNHHDDDFKAEHDIEAYCDCFINSLKNDFTTAEYGSGDFVTSEKYANMKAKCKEAAKK